VNILKTKSTKHKESPQGITGDVSLLAGYGLRFSNYWIKLQTQQSNSQGSIIGDGEGWKVKIELNLQNFYLAELSQQSALHHSDLILGIIVIKKIT